MGIEIVNEFLEGLIRFIVSERVPIDLTQKEPCRVREDLASLVNLVVELFEVEPDLIADTTIAVFQLLHLVMLLCQSLLQLLYLLVQKVDGFHSVGKITCTANLLALVEEFHV